MKKNYFAPVARTINIEAESMLAQSGGVETGSKVGNSYKSSDVSYSKEREGSSIWGD